MKLTDKNIWKYEGIILLCCIIAMLLHPLSFMEITWLILHGAQGVPACREASLRRESGPSGHCLCDEELGRRRT